MSFSSVALSRLPKQCRILALLPVALQNLTKFLLLKASYALVTGHRESDQVGTNQESPSMLASCHSTKGAVLALGL